MGNNMGNNMIINIFVIILVTIIVITGDIFIKNSSDASGIKQILYFTAGVLIYAGVAFIFEYLYKQMDFSTIGAIYALMTILLSMGMGLLLYKEVINPLEMVGVVLAIISIYLLARFA